MPTCPSIDHHGWFVNYGLLTVVLNACSTAVLILHVLKQTDKVVGRKDWYLSLHDIIIDYHTIMFFIQEIPQKGIHSDIICWADHMASKCIEIYRCVLVSVCGFTLVCPLQCVHISSCLNCICNLLETTPTMIMVSKDLSVLFNWACWIYIHFGQTAWGLSQSALIHSTTWGGFKLDWIQSS